MEKVLKPAIPILFIQSLLDCTEQSDQNINNNSDNIQDEFNLSEIINFFKRNYKFLWY